MLLFWLRAGSLAFFLAIIRGEALAADSPESIFKQRLLPIFQSPNPSSCLECHLAGVDLKNYILPSHERTFISLRDRGLIDLQKPRQSRILQLIAMGGTNSGAGAALIQQKVREQELAGFTEWIVASVQDPKLRNAPPEKPPAGFGATRPMEVVRYARKDRVVDSFEQQIWSQRFRCSGCHQAGGPENAKLVAEHGDEVNWMKETPEATFAYLVESKLINAGDPERSKLLLKPLNELKHGGGQKMVRGDLSFQTFNAFLSDYARTAKNGYSRPEELPKPDPWARVGTDIWIKLSNTLPEWADRLLRVDLHAWDSESQRWEENPIAQTDRMVWGKGKLWQHNLVLMARKDSARAKLFREKGSLAPGKYQARVYLDESTPGVRADKPNAAGPFKFVGAAEVESSWPSGYGKMTAIDSAAVR